MNKKLYKVCLRRMQDAEYEIRAESIEAAWQKAYERLESENLHVTLDWELFSDIELLDVEEQEESHG